jgi:hypothetical protein
VMLGTGWPADKVAMSHLVLCPFSFGFILSSVKTQGLRSVRSHIS